MRILLNEEQWKKMREYWKQTNEDPNAIYPETDLNKKFYHPRIAHLKPNITYRCDRGCWNCNRAAGVCPATTREDMDPGQLKALLEESVKIGKEWTHITLTGGEPTMHDRFGEFVDIIMDYKNNHFQKCIADVYTYHHPKHYYKVEEALKKHPGLIIKDTGKSTVQPQRWAMYNAPVDDPKLGANHIYGGCNDGARLCGLGLDTTGLYFCSVACGVARVFGFKGIQSLSELTVENLIFQFQNICSKRGFYARYNTRGQKKNIISPTWRKAIDQWRANNGSCSQ